LLIQAAADELLAQDAEWLAVSASAAGVDVTYTSWPGMRHDFALEPGLLGCGGRRRDVCRLVPRQGSPGMNGAAGKASS
jgi:acetyl esterase/lipase